MPPDKSVLARWRGADERPCFQMVPIWEPRFLYSTRSGVTCYSFSRREASSFSSKLGCCLANPLIFRRTDHGDRPAARLRRSARPARYRCGSHMGTGIRVARAHWIVGAGRGGPVSASGPTLLPSSSNKALKRPTSAISQESKPAHEIDGIRCPF